MKIAIVDPRDPEALVGTVVVIDVLRAFTTAAFAIASGAREISLVTTVDEALELRKRIGDARLVGEVGGYAIEGFDAGNSPSEFVDRTVEPRWIQRTTAGTRSARLASGADHLLVTGMVTLQATVAYIQRLAPPATVLVISGRYGRFDGEEDRACADLLAARLRGQSPDPEPFIERVRRSQGAAKFLDPAKPAFPPRDLDLACELDRFDFAMAGHREGDQLVIRPVTD